jgi:hypothetical protein
MSEHTQVASYALGLLDPIEMTNFEIHLAECDECGDQLEWLLPVAGQLSEVEPGDLYGVSGPSAFTTVASESPQQQPNPGRNQPPAQPTAFPPARGQHTGEIPTSPTSPTRSPWTGEIPVRSPRSGEIPISGRRASEFPELREPTGEVPISGPPTGENRIVPLVRGGESRRRQAKLAQDAQSGQIPVVSPPTGPTPVPDYPRPDRTERVERVAESFGGSESYPQPRSYDSPPTRPRRPDVDAFEPRRRNRGLVLATAAAFIGALAGAGAVAAHPWSSGNDSVAGIAISQTGDKLAATDGKTGVRADVVMDQKAWGTLVSFAVSEVDGPRNCRLVAVRADGKSEVLSSWTVPPQGYNAGTEPPELTLQASTALKRKDITSLQVQDVRPTGATTLVTIPT